MNETKDSKRERDTGKYAPEVERPCVCGHGLGQHSAERLAGEQPCFAGDEGEPCACQCFKRVRKPKAAK